MTYEPSDELVEKVAGLLPGRWAYLRLRQQLIAAVESGELVPRDRLEQRGWVYSQPVEGRMAPTWLQEHPDQVPVYRIVEPAQPNDRGE